MKINHHLQQLAEVAIHTMSQLIKASFLNYSSESARLLKIVPVISA
jgi:hypothetical protein